MPFYLQLSNEILSERLARVAVDEQRYYVDYCLYYSYLLPPVRIARPDHLSHKLVDHRRLSLGEEVAPWERPLFDHDHAFFSDLN